MLRFSIGRSVAAGLAIIGLAAAAFAVQTSELAAKQVAAPAEDIRSGLVRLPEPEALATISRAQIVELDFVWRAGAGWSCETSLPVERDGPLALALFSTDAARWRWSIAQPGGPLAPIDGFARGAGFERRMQVLEDEFSGWVVDRLDIAGARAGAWTVRVEVPRAGPLERPARGYLIAVGAGELRLAAHMATLATLADEDVAILAHVEPAGARVDAGELRLETDSDVRTIAMLDDGLHADGAAADGVFGAFVPRGVRGDVHASVRLAGTTDGGAAFSRSALLAFPVIERRTALTGAVTASVTDRLRLGIEVEAWPLGPADKLHVSAEVWGTDAAGELVPVCWLSRMLVPREDGANWRLPLELDGRWLNQAAARAPLELRGVRVQDPDTDVLFDALERIPLEVAELPAVVGQTPGPITRDMLMGSTSSGATPAGAAHGSIPPHLLAPTLMLVHGYCSGGAIWPAADFTQPKTVFLDPNANRTHDQFAQLIAAAGAAYGSFGIVAHSQGGAAALHLYTYYPSGLDWAVGNRLIQSVATPYQGTPLASFGGFACGVNNDMTPAGSATWLAGIPSWARAQVYFWTTADAGTACNSLTNLFLTDPEDGTVEMFRGQLPGGNSMGHVTGWCHTTGMTYPANYTDHTRNAQMNVQAAR